MGFVQSYRNCYPTVYSPDGYELKRNVANGTGRAITLDVNGYIIPIVERSRSYKSNIQMRLKGNGYSYEDWYIAKHTNSFTQGMTATYSNCYLLDEFTETRSNLYYLDLKNSIAAWRQTKTTIKLDGQGFVEPVNTPKNTNLLPDPWMFQFVKFPDASITKQVIIEEYILFDGVATKISSLPTESSDYNQPMYIDFTGGAIIDQRLAIELADYYHWIPYYIDGAKQTEPDGYDFFEPWWIPADGFDEIINSYFPDYYSSFTPINEKVQMQEVPPFVIMETMVDTFPRGSWAVDVLGNFFVSQVTADGKVYNNLTDGDPVKLTGLNGSNPVFFPIAPV